MKTTIQCNVTGERLDTFIAASIPGVTRSAAQKLIDAGQVTLDGTHVRKNHKTSTGELYKVIQNEPDVSAVIKQDIPLDIIYEDTDIIVVNKPRAMVVHPAPGHPDGTLVNALLHHCGDSLSGIGGIKRPGIVHRIDKDTSGLVIAAKNDKTHVSLAEQLSSRTLVREYHAVVCGSLKNDSGTINAPIGRHPKDRKKQAVYSADESTPLKKGVRSAVTHYETVARYGNYTHVRCRLETGRTHQIRVHMAFIGHPILGDTVYGRKKPELGMSSQCLHAWKLQFIHPSTGNNIELFAELPHYFTDILEELEKRA
ncbi:MAG: RluA family pseudouridine synthase [Oscillospiraceae bacterium]|nr:RluA family pseudouridine synthase [Oscillospiraceae bacterium]